VIAEPTGVSKGRITAFIGISPVCHFSHDERTDLPRAEYSKWCTLHSTIYTLHDVSRTL